MATETLPIETKGFNLADLLTILASLETEGATHVELTIQTDDNAENTGIKIEGLN